MARLNEHTSLVAVTEREKHHIKILYTKDGKVKRFKTNVYVKNAKLFNQEKIFRKSNAANLNDFQNDKTKLDEAQLKIESLVSEFIDQYHDKPTITQIDNLILTYKEADKVNHTSIEFYLEEYYKLYEARGRNGKSVVSAFRTSFNHFIKHKNLDYDFNDINETFFSDLIDYFLYTKPKNIKLLGKPTHILTEPVQFDDRFGMNNNTLLKRLDVCMSFLKWAITKKNIKQDYDQIKELIKKVKKDLQITEYSNIEFAFKKREEIRQLASQEFDATLKDDTYIELISGKEVKRMVSRDVLIRAKDYFVISTLTANRISDLKLIKRHHIELGKQKAKKTKNEFLLNSNQTIKELLEKHNFTLGLNDQKYNRCIKVFLRQFYQDFLQKEEKVWVKEIRGKYEQYKEVEYWKLAGSHSGRRSFASVLYNEGRYPKRMIMSFTGHTSEQEFDKYIQLNAVEDIQQVSDFMNINYL